MHHAWMHTFAHQAILQEHLKCVFFVRSGARRVPSGISAGFKVQRFLCTTAFVHVIDNHGYSDTILINVASTDCKIFFCGNDENFAFVCAIKANTHSHMRVFHS